MHLRLRLRSAFAGLLCGLWILTACGQGSVSTTTPTEPATEAPQPTAAPSPTIAASPTPQDVGLLPEVQEALQKLESDNYDGATQTLIRVKTQYPESAKAKDLLADAYLKWGRSQLAAAASAENQLALVASALDKFIAGLAVPPADPATATTLEQEASRASAFLEAVRSQDAFRNGRAQLDAATRRSEAARVVASLDALATDSPAYPGLAPRLALALVDQGEALLDNKELAPAEREPLARQAQELCARAGQLDAGLEAAGACAQTAADQITAAQRPTPVPTRPRPNPTLVVTLKSRGDTAGCISMQIQGVGAAGWTLRVDGTNLAAQFDGGNNARLCGLPPNDVTFTIFSQTGQRVRGGGGVPARGGDIFLGTWK